MIFDKHVNLNYKFGNRKFWAEGYYVSTVGLNEAMIKKYIQQQEKNDIIQTSYADPFKGSQGDKGTGLERSESQRRLGAGR